MNIPKRKGNAPVEATQELQALDVLEIVETLKNAPRAAAGTASGPVVTRKALASNSSIAPVGLDLMPQRAAADEEVNPTMEIRLPVRRRRLGGIVIGAVAGCALILVAAGVARVGHASSSPDPTSPAAITTTTAAATPLDTAAAPTPVPGTVAPASLDGASTGTVRLDRPAVVGHVWLDGKKLSSRSALVSCGTHQIKVGHGRTHSVDVPCGAEIGVSK
jgi:hypothetical protein